jgi:Putative Sin3 binding protein
MHNTASQRLVTTEARIVRRNSKSKVDAGHRPDILPTPPNSLSPYLLPHPHQRAVSPSNTISGGTLLGTESEFGSEHEGGGRRGKHATSPWSNADIKAPITTDTLAKHYLPEIFKRVNGSVTGEIHVKDILKHLRTLPNFERLDNQTGRRKVTAALENRLGGSNGDVMYNKVKWGVWEAVPMDGQDVKGSDELAQAQKPKNRPAPISVPSVKTSDKSSVESPASAQSSNAVESDFDDEADAMSLDGEPEIRVLKQRRRKVRHFVPPTAEDDSEVTEDDDWEPLGSGSGFRAPSMSSYAASYSSRRGSHASMTRPSLMGTGSLAMDIKGAHHRRGSHHGSAPKHRYLSLPNGAVFSHDLARSLTYQGGIVPFEETYSHSLKVAAREQRRRRKQSRHDYSDENRRKSLHKHSMDGVLGLSVPHYPTHTLVNAGQSAQAAAGPSQTSEMEVAKALLDLSTFAHSPSLASPIASSS